MSDAFRPGTVDELRDAVRACGAEGRTIRLAGGGVVACPPREGALGVSLAALTGVVAYQPADLVATVRAGTTVADLATVLRERGQRFPLLPHDDGARATVGGVFAAGADGLRARGGFRARDVILGARALLAGPGDSGDEVTVGARVVKSVAGFDVARALAGSRGVLAALLEVTFRVEALPVEETALSASCESLAAAQRVAQAIARLPLQPTALVVRRDGAAWRVDALYDRRPASLVAWHASGFRDAECSFDLSPNLRLMSPGAEGIELLDVLRGRAYGRVAVSAEPRETTGLLERVRHAFDPAHRWQPGRGLGAS